MARMVDSSEASLPGMKLSVALGAPFQSEIRGRDVHGFTPADGAGAAAGDA